MDGFRTEDEIRKRNEWARPSMNSKDEHELEFEFDSKGHVSKVTCSCGVTGTVEML